MTKLKTMIDQSELMIMIKLQAMVTLRQARGVGRDDVVLSTPPCESHSMHRGEHAGPQL